MSIWRWVRRVWITLGLTATLVFVVWSLIAFRASPAARGAQESNAAVQVVRYDGLWRFMPSRLSDDRAGLIFFPGGLVDPGAYAPLARAVAEAGFEAVIVELPRRGAFGGAKDPRLYERARALMRDTAGPDRWIVAGHSRGGAVASQLVSERPRGLAGLVLVGTTHPRDVDLSHLLVPVTKIVGTRDGLARSAGVEANRHLLPASTRWIRTEGANHSQFGWYGFQPGDRFASIPADEQRAMMIAGVLDALRAAATADRRRARFIFQ